MALLVRLLAVGSVGLAAFGVTGPVGPLLLALVVPAGVMRLSGRSPWALVGSASLGVLALVAAGLQSGPDGYAFGAVLLVVADLGIQRGGALGAAAGGVATAATLGPDLLLTPGAVVLAPTVAWTAMLLPLAGVAFGAAHRDLPVTGGAALRATTAALDELIALVDRLPLGLDRWSVAGAMVDELRTTVQPVLHEGVDARDAAHLLVVVDGVLRGVGRPWDRRPLGLAEELPSTRSWHSFASRVDAADLPFELASSLRDGRWLLGEVGDGLAWVLLPGDLHSSVHAAVQELFRDFLVALSNVERFEHVQAAALDVARHRLAHDLHDGVAQSLTHVRFELEMLEMESDPSLAAELRRLREAADAALLEVRGMVDDLRQHGPFLEALTGHVHALRGFARLEIRLDLPRWLVLPSTMDGELLRIAQEALANALRHSGGSMVEVSVEQDADAVVLVVADDGTGMHADRRHEGAGVGMDAMRERARRIGGTVTVDRRRGGGTRVEVTVPAGHRPPRTAAGPSSERGVATTVAGPARPVT